MPPSNLVDLSRIDPDHVAFTIEQIREHNPQRYEFEQLSHIAMADFEAREVCGVLDIPADPWWGRGHVPAKALMPGVLMLEAAAQTCSWFVHQVIDSSENPGKIFGFGGIDNVKFRSAVFPPDRLVIVGKCVKISRRRAIFETQGLHGDMERIAFEATITGLWV
ncbi:MAG: beta-hydroxyacyl-ACP dehydratase [Planctomycetota bacterium]|nr:beta-hydroxyacyl-ACP dehydratase [Planctomycetota bacterium]